jgi:hypothetical protein
MHIWILALSLAAVFIFGGPVNDWLVKWAEDAEFSDDDPIEEDDE